MERYRGVARWPLAALLQRDPDRANASVDHASGWRRAAAADRGSHDDLTPGLVPIRTAHRVRLDPRARRDDRRHRSGSLAASRPPKRVSLEDERVLDVSPDGSRIVYVDQRKRLRLIPVGRRTSGHACSSTAPRMVRPGSQILARRTRRICLVTRCSIGGSRCFFACRSAAGRRRRRSRRQFDGRGALTRDRCTSRDIARRGHGDPDARG